MDDNKHIVLLDVDGVIGDFLTPAYEIAKKLFNTSKQPHEQNTWDMVAFLEMTQQEAERFFGYIKRPGFHSKMQPYPGATEGVAELHKLVNVHIVTSPMFGPTWCSERWDWLHWYFSIKSKDVTHTHHKQYVDGHVLIDDKPDNVNEWQKKHPFCTAMLWDQPYNKDAELHKDVVRVHNWNEIISKVKDIIRG